MKRFLRRFKEYYFYDKHEDESNYGYDKFQVEDAMSEIDSELSTIEDYIIKGEIGKALDLIEKLKEML